MANKSIPFYYKWLFLALGFLLVIFLFKSLFLRVFHFIRTLFLSVGTGLTSEQIRVKSDELFQAMDGSGTDENKIYQVLTGTTKKDFYAISQEFGLKDYDRYFGREDIIFGTKRTLEQWLSFELNENEKAQLKQIAPYFAELGF
ncbi:hypothetical protein [Zhouia amylolytica]|uniref:hypothetical protein n=1 Tax=Zhouia amylolytica TaxID=376730 RepID=UPI0020CFAAF2|nr:hypothetical protein [Zhouia amylolytica]MCQ0113038.1 hypothetical protein [Zhouia amylolytica]